MDSAAFQAAAEIAAQQDPDDDDCLINFMETYEKFKPNFTKKDMKAFSKLKTNTARIAFLWKHREAQDAIQLVPKYKAKCADTSKTYRLEGNKFFQKKEFAAAVGKFNLSVMTAPWDEIADGGENAFALALVNRSMGLQQLHQYADSVEDLTQALAHGYSKENAYKLHDRKGKCYALMRDKEHAMQCFQDGLKALSLTTLKEKDITFWKNVFEKQIEDLQQIVGDPIPGTKCIPKPPEITGERNSFYPNMSNAFAVSYDDEVGRYAVAADDIKVGDVIGVENPYSSVMYHECHPSHCNHCFKLTTLPFPCSQCTNIVYCSASCQQAALTYHQVECQYMGWLHQTWVGTLGHLALRTTLMMKADELLDFLSKQDEFSLKTPKTPLDANTLSQEELCSFVYKNDYSSVYYLMNHAEHRNPDDLLQFTFLSILLLKVIKESGKYIKENMPIDALMSVGSAVLRNLQIVQCNAYAVAEMQQVSDFRSAKPKDIGLALYPTAGLINHSCDPAVDLVFYGNTAVLRVMRDVDMEQDITVDYGCVFFTHKKEDRYVMLKSQYFFDCDCIACSNDWPLWDKLDSKVPVCRCQSCGARLNVKDVHNLLTCRMCDYQQHPEVALEQLQESHARFAKGMQTAIARDFSAALPDLQSHLSLMQKLLVPPWRDYYSCQATIKQCYRMMGNTSTE